MSLDDYKKIIRMAEHGNREGLLELSKEELVDYIIEDNTGYRKDEKDIKKLCSDFINNTDLVNFNRCMRDMNRKLTDTEEERDKILDEKQELEVHLEQSCHQMEMLEKKLNDMPKAGRPQIYSDEFREKVRSYYKAGHTYRDTACHFNISTNTVGRFIKESN